MAIEELSTLDHVHTQQRPRRMRVAINLLTEDPANPSGAHWFWTRVIPEMATRLAAEEELHLLVSPRARHAYQGYGPNVRYITYPWSNEQRTLRTLSEHVYSPIRLPLAGIDVFNTLMAPIANPSWSLVLHIKTMHAFTQPGSISALAHVDEHRFLRSRPEGPHLNERLPGTADRVRQRLAEVSSVAVVIAEVFEHRQVDMTGTGRAQRPR